MGKTAYLHHSQSTPGFFWPFRIRPKVPLPRQKEQRGPHSLERKDNTGGARLGRLSFLMLNLIYVRPPILLSTVWPDDFTQFDIYIFLLCACNAAFSHSWMHYIQLNTYVRVHILYILYIVRTCKLQTKLKIYCYNYHVRSQAWYAKISDTSVTA